MKIFKHLQEKYNLKQELDKSFKLLTPFLDENGIIRVGGRLQNSLLPYDTKHPILLPNCDLVLQIMTEVHYNNMHAGPNTLLSIVRQRLWPVKGKVLASRIFRNCILCRKLHPITVYQLMGNLPEGRVISLAPFAITGVDYAGPITVHYKCRGMKTTKAYIALFICFQTKAVHLEIVSDLTSNAFIACLKRFISRRGKPIKIMSDNGSNFVGAREELIALKAFLSEEESNLNSSAAKLGTEWSMIPPRAPHLGGLCEASVKRTKQLIKATINSLTFEELNTLI